MMIFPVSSRKTKSLALRMASLGVKGSDLKETFIRSGGPGGQNVNKVATCVVLKYLPTGLTVKCQRDRSQAMNRYLARRILVDTLESQLRGRQSDEAKRIAKIRRQKRKRSSRAKDKMLASKKAQGGKKELRRRVDSE